ncbi:hypothetical protein [Streptomyces sp. NPDC057623]|uniref:hypothetical protein n=1 Tax=Streptomyces sp. NPDC057623 TaxID=3346187 RepID=UPI003698CCF0
MLSRPERPWTWRASPGALRRGVTARASLLWLIATAVLFATCLISFLAWAAEDRSATLTPSSGRYQSTPPGDQSEEPPAEEAPAEEPPVPPLGEEQEDGAPAEEPSAEEEFAGEAPPEEAPAEETPGEEAPAEEEPTDEGAVVSDEDAPASPSVLPVVVSGVSGFGGLLSGVAAILTVRQAAGKGRSQQAPPSTHAGRACGCRRGRVGPSPVRLRGTGEGS